MDNIQSASRRTVLKVGAWSVPVIAAAVATPLAAASTAVDLQFWLLAGDGYSIDNAAGTRRLNVSLPSRFSMFTTAGTVPAGTTISIKYDNRFHFGPSAFLDADDTPLAMVGDIVSDGIRSTATFTVPVPVTTDWTVIGLEFETNGREFHDDYATMIATAIAPGGDDPDPTNNTRALEGEYEDLPLP
ncbi:hypothetical protein [Microbacterium sp.]|uniref:hypothetical protein n=1 Tax=Microbacterium sp. TaxID=51671 RepID=UPI002811967D|nr:hypothetical protein [Microbacterium sp.]